MEEYPSGQRGQTVNLLALVFDGSNPSPSTIFISSQANMREWWNWQTRQIQVLVVLILCRFKSCLSHHHIFNCWFDQFVSNLFLCNFISILFFRVRFLFAHAILYYLPSFYKKKFLRVQNHNGLVILFVQYYPQRIYHRHVNYYKIFCKALLWLPP